jgi:hypothetical protein
MVCLFVDEIPDFVKETLMFIPVPRRSLTRLVLPVALVVAVAALQADHSWGNYHWARTANPFTLKVGNNLSGAWEGHLDNAIDDWNLSTVLDLQKVAGGTRPKSCKATPGQIEVCNASWGNNGWLGLAQIWASGSHITQGTAKMNDYYFNQPAYNTPGWRQLVMCQEIAHDFGLDHQDETFNNRNLGTCMDYTNDPDGGAGGAVNNDPTNVSPNQHDYNQLETIYAHLDGTTTVGQTVTRHPPAMNGIDWDSAANWGQLKRSTNGGRTQVFEQDFGGGNRVITFVIWADGEARGRRGE